MTFYIEHHILAIVSCCSSCLALLSTQPETDAIMELRELLEYQFDILDCIIQDRHFGSDGLDAVIEQCNEIINQVEGFNKK